VNENLKKKAKDTASIRAKLENELEAVNVELAMLFDERDRLKDLLHKQKAPLKVNLQCIEIRAQRCHLPHLFPDVTQANTNPYPNPRPPTEAISDDVEKLLKKQKHNLESTYNTIRKIMVQVDERIRKVEDIKQRLRGLLQPYPNDPNTNPNPCSNP